MEREKDSEEQKDFYKPKGKQAI